MKHQFPIIEHDACREALISPRDILKPLEGFPENCVLCFFQSAIDALKARGKLEEIAHFKSEMGQHKIYRLDGARAPVAVFHPGIGGPLAAGLLEEAIVLGGKRFIACGGAGVLDKSHAKGSLLVPVSAVRDEGTSYHYLPPSREVASGAAAVSAIQQTLDELRIPHRAVKTWTTDAFYRETPGKIAMRKAEGCECVEMEAASLFAVAKFRNVELGQILYAGDDVSGDSWDSRSWNECHSLREALVTIAADACLRLEKLST